MVLFYLRVLNDSICFQIMKAFSLAPPFCGAGFAQSFLLTEKFSSNKNFN
uniref:Uncharacterized protein n=1 Tax=Siphoviridae sp. ctB3v5 TaxID=2826186 RepID=A0A8S5M922_9CAUD|nr:MAG TPA: hypothetical protein [Siphoviridae sp. ctB3v5]